MARILLAEDDVAVRDFVSRVLSMDGHEIEVAHEGQEALRLITCLGDPYDLLLSDIRMPVIDGVTLSKLVYRQQPKMPILLMTGYASGALDDQASSVVGVLQKPFTVEGVQEAVRSGLGHRPCMAF